MARNSRNRRNNNLSLIQRILRVKTSTVLCICLILFLIFLLAFSWTKILIMKTSQQAIEQDIQKISNLATSEEPQKSRTFTLCAIGDVMCHNTQYMDAYNSATDDYDFSYVFEDIAQYLQTPDITIGSLETSFAGKEAGYSNYPTFNSPDALAEAISNIGVDILSTSGNHCLDKGYSGLSRTIDVLEYYNLDHLGTYKTKEDSEKILYKEINGVKIAFLNYTYGTNGIPLPSDKPFCVNLIDKDVMKTQLEQAKAEGAEMIVACMHWGTEYRTTANDEQEELADFLFQNGADIILGNHPHTLEPMEKRTVKMPDGTEKECFVIYALGNFICDQNAENTLNSIILNLDITCDSKGKISIDNINYIPINMYKNTNVATHKFKVLDIEKRIENYENGTDKTIGNAKYEDLKTQLEKIKSIIGENF